MNKRCGTWNVRSLYLAGSLTTVARQLAKYKLDVMRVQEVRWDRGGTEQADNYLFFCANGNESDKLRT
jgi:exonuclease III